MISWFGGGGEGGGLLRAASLYAFVSCVLTSCGLGFSCVLHQES